MPLLERQIKWSREQRQLNKAFKKGGIPEESPPKKKIKKNPAKAMQSNTPEKIAPANLDL